MSLDLWNGLPAQRMWQLAAAFLDEPCQFDRSRRNRGQPQGSVAAHRPRASTAGSGRRNH